MDKKLENEIREAVLSAGSTEIGDLLITKTQRKLLKRIMAEPMTSKQLSKKDDISLPNANSKLERLRKGGYVTRSNVGDPTGGNMFEYECTALVLNVHVLA